MKIHKNDTVLIISGKDSGKKGKVLKSFPDKGKILVEGIAMIKRHQRPKKSGEKGQIVELPSPINVANAQIICPKCGKAARIGYKIEGEKKYRFCKKCNSEI